MNQNYWLKFYRDKEKSKPSAFAKFCYKFIKPGDQLIEVASGDGRDSVLFQQKGNLKVAVEPNNSLITKLGIGQFVGTFDDFVMRSQGALFDYDIVYARWFIHAVPEETENLLIEFAKEKNATLMLEFRIEGDKPDDTHKRRLINPEKFLEKLTKNGFSIKYYKQGYGFSKKGKDDPYLARVIAEH